MPSIRQLEYFVALAETRHFRRASERCHTTQPTLSEQIKTLEERLGAQLVERSRSGAILTPVGLQICNIARRIVRDVSEIRLIATGANETLKGVLRLGVPSTIGPYLLPYFVPVLHRYYPELKLYVREEVPQTLPRTLEDGGHDLIITPLPVHAEELHATGLFREPLFLTLAADHPLAGKEIIDKADLRDQVVLTLGSGHQLHDVVQNLCKEFGAQLHTDYEGTSLDMLREMIITGLGISFMPGLYVRRELLGDRSLEIRRIRGRSIYRMIGMVWRKSTARNDTFEKIAGICREVAHAHFGDLAIIKGDT